MTLIVTCPSCRTRHPYRSDWAWRPFCSERCRQRDLGTWAQEQYRLPAEMNPMGEDGLSAADDAASRQG